MAHIYALANQKGGTAKTATTAALGAAFSELRKRVLLCDLDPQAGLTISLGQNPETFERTIYHALLGQVALAAVTIQTAIPSVALVPSNLDLAGLEAELIGEIGWDRTLKDALAPLQQEYDYILLDCPPSLGVLTTNALVAAHTIIVPMQCEYLSLRALKQLQVIVEKVRRKANPELGVKLLRTMYDSRTTHAREIFEEIARIGGEHVYQTFIKRTIKFADATIAGEPILTYATDSEAADAYRALAKEITNYG